MSDDYIISTSDTTQEPTECIGSTMFTGMKMHKEKVAQIDVKTGQIDKFGELLQRCIRTALHMSDKHVTREHIISLCTNNHLNAAIPYISTQFLGAKMAPLDPSLTAQEMTHLFKLVRPKMIFAIPESVPILEKIVQDTSVNCEIVVFGQTIKHTEFSEFLKPHRNEKEFEPVKINNLKDIAFIHFSSGSTGLPKGICLSHYSFLGQIISYQLITNPNYYYMRSVNTKATYPTMLSHSTLYWSVGGLFLTNSVIQGFCRLIIEKFNPKEIWNLIQKYKPTLIILRSIHVTDMLAHRKKDVDVQSVLCIIFAGSHASKNDFLKIQNVFPQAYVTLPYGQTEAGLISLFNPDDTEHRTIKSKPETIESSGLPIKGITYKVVDIDSNKSLGPGQRGELQIKSKFMMSGYYKQESSEAFDEDGWLKTGDIVYYDEYCCFYIVDRIKESFKYQGWFIVPAVLENELMEHPAVKQAVVIGIPDQYGHLPMGLVVVREGFQVCEKEIEKFVEERVPGKQKLRGGVKFVDCFPVTPTGKLKKKEIRDMVLDGKL